MAADVYTEPPYVGQPNGLDLFVTNTKTGEKVNGLEGALKAEIIHGSSRRTLDVTAQDGVDGAYTADIVPTATGDYTWHISGTIQGTPVDVSMTSSPTTFNSVDAMASNEFPVVYPSATELQAQAAATAQTAQMALIVGIVGIVLGAAGLVVALTLDLWPQPMRPGGRPCTGPAPGAVNPRRSLPSGADPGSFQAVRRGRKGGVAS